jgi:hypothetical protein
LLAQAFLKDGREIKKEKRNHHEKILIAYCYHKKVSMFLYEWWTPKLPSHKII